MAKKVAKKSTKKAAKKTVKKSVKKESGKSNNSAVKASKASADKKATSSVKKASKKTAAKMTKKDVIKTSEKKAAKSVDTATASKAGNSTKSTGSKKVVAAKAVEPKSVKEKKSNVTGKAKKTTRKSAKKSSAPAAPEIKRGLKLAPGVLISGQKSTEKKECSADKAHRKISKKEVEAIKKRLLEMREDILEGVRKELAESKNRASSAPADIIDQAADAYDNDVSFEIAAASDEELEQIEAALERISEGHYGECEMCSAIISPSRLKILPFATRCVDCRGSYEKTKRRRESGMRNFFGDGERAEGSTDE